MARANPRRHCDGRPGDACARPIASVRSLAVESAADAGHRGTTRARKRRTRAARRGALVAPGPSRTHSSASRSPAAGMLERLFVLACSPRTSVSCGLIYARLEQYSRTNDSVFTSIRSGDGVSGCMFRCADGVHSSFSFTFMQLLESHGPGKVKPPKGLRCARSRARMPPVRMLLALTRKQVHRSAQPPS